MKDKESMAVRCYAFLCMANHHNTRLIAAVVAGWVFKGLTWYSEYGSTMSRWHVKDGKAVFNYQPLPLCR